MKRINTFHTKILIILIGSIATILCLSIFDEYLQSYIEKEVINVLTPLIIFVMIMKLLGLGKIQYVDGKNFFQLLIQMIYQFRYAFAFLIIFTMSFQNFGKDASLATVMGEYLTDSTKEQVLTVYHVDGEHVYNHKNRVYQFYNKELEIKENNTYKITYLETSNIIVDLQGPLNTKNYELEDTVQVTSVEYKDGAATIAWDPFFFEGKESKQYRVKSFIQQEDGTLLRSGSQLVVEDKETSVTVKNIRSDKEYQFIIEPYINGEYNDEYKGTSEFISTK